MSRYFIELTQPEIKAQFERHPLVILPCGSVEQHGAHLPTGTDIFAANSAVLFIWVISRNNTYVCQLWSIS